MPYIDPSVITQAKQVDLPTYLQEREPDELVRTGPTVQVNSIWNLYPQFRTRPQKAIVRAI